MKKKIFVNARFLTQQISGVQRFAIEISKELKKIGYPITFLAPRNIFHTELAKELEVETLGVLNGYFWEQIELQSYVFFKKGLLISFCNTAPLFLKNQIVTVHDLCFRIYPQWFSKPFSLIYNFMIPKICNNSKAIITVSETSKKELHHELGIPARKIHVIYNGVAEVFRKCIDSNELPTREDYVLVVSSHHPRKNFERLIKAFDLIDQDVKLYIVGNVNKNFNSRKLKSDRNIVILEDVSDQDLVKYYKFAKVFVFPSLYEGFGIPIIEAMIMNVPVCVSDIQVFHEICGDNAVYFDPMDMNDIRNKIVSALEFPLSPDKMDMSRFNWKNSALKLIELIRFR